MNCRDFILEFEERAVLTEAAQMHLNDCPGCRKTTVVQTHIWEAIASIPPVNAPKNFDFKVNARIANAQPTDFQPKFLPVLRYVLPFAAIFLVFGLLIANTSLFFGNNNEIHTAEVIPRMPEASETAPKSFAASETAAVNTDVLPAPPVEQFVVNNTDQTAKPIGDKQDKQFAVFKSAKKTAVAPRREIVKNNADGGGSNDKAITAPLVLMPEGITSSAVREISPNPIAPSAAGEDIWSFVGIEIASENGSRVVKAVKQNSAAARASLKIGDVITAIDGVKLSAAPINRQKFEIKSLTVTRGTEKLEIAFTDK